MTAHTTQRITLTLQLKDAIIISQKSATEGMHQSLDYIPGANFLGAIASRLYAQLKKDEEHSVFDLFHSGQVRFGNAFPMQNNQPSYPMPLSLHFFKGESKNTLVNRLYPVEKNDEGKQFKQQRKGYLTAEKQHIIPIRHLHLKTAIHNQTGTAKASQLFGYQSIQAGLVYQTHIDVDTPEIAEYLFSAIKQMKHFYVGRSKTAQYGCINITSVTKKVLLAPIITPVELQNQKSIVLWLASDLVAYNLQGQPTLTPTLKELNLLPEDAEDVLLDCTRSWLRTRSYSHYNSYRKSYDLEQQAICQGSLLVYPADNIDIDHLQQQLCYGIGCYTESGHGQVVSQTQTWQFIFDQTLSKQANTQSKPNPVPLSGLVQELQNKYNQQQNQQTLQQQVEKDLEAFITLYKHAKAYQGVSEQVELGPSRTQWGRIRNELTKQHFTTKEQVSQFLFDGNTAIIKAKDEAWSVGDYQQSFATLLKAKINDFSDEERITHYLRALAREAAHSPKLNAARGAQL